MFSMNRWVLRRQRKLLSIGVALLLFMIVYITLVHDDIKIDEKHYQPFSEVCLTGKGEFLLRQLCQNHSEGIAFGNICHDICLQKQFDLRGCIHHGTTYVLLGKLRSQNVALKMKQVNGVNELRGSFERFIDHFTTNINSIRDFFVERISYEVRGRSGRSTYEALTRNIDTVFRRLFNSDRKTISLTQMQNSWSLIAQDEVVLYAIHQNMASFTKLIGTCGSIYAIEQVRPFSDYFPTLIYNMKWEERVAIALSFLDLIDEFEKSVAGPLSHCDIQEANFGITPDFRVKAVDIDLVYDDDRLVEILGQPKCDKDLDCNFFDCQSSCNMETRQCGNFSITNNLQVMCRDIFTPTWPMKGLLSSIPSSVNKRLNGLLTDCKSEQFGKFRMQHGTVQGLIKELRNVLTFSLSKPSSNL